MSETTQALYHPTSRLGRIGIGALEWLEKAVLRHSLVGRTAFFERDQFPWLVDFEAATDAIRNEIEPLLSWRDAMPAFQEISEEIGYINKDRDWKTFMLIGYGARSQVNLQRCPHTAQALNLIPGLKTAFFSILEPGKRIPPHRGPYAGLLRIHLPLIVPEPRERCWIRVGEERRNWTVGEAMIFDDAFEHEVHNDTNGIRVVLFIDFLRPCRWPISALNGLVMAVLRYTPFVRNAQKRQQAWERARYGSDDKRISEPRPAENQRNGQHQRLENGSSSV